MAQQSLGILTIVRVESDADAGPDLQREAVDLERLGDHFVEAPGELADRLHPYPAACGDQEGELVTAEAGDEVILASTDSSLGSIFCNSMSPA